MTITSEQIKLLREKTGAGMLNCKNALVETKGDFEKALNLLRQKAIKIVPYGGFGSNDNYTIELQLSLDSIKGWGQEDQDSAEKKNVSGAESADTSTPPPPPEPPTT
jgi:hypothetical protein